MKLVIIEGAGKKDTIKKYLGSGYNVMATGGHFRDLKQNALSVDVENNYQPEYVIIPKSANPKGKPPKEVVKELKNAASQCDDVLIATDPDREGEAIAWHLTYVLGLPHDSVHRIEFNEITKNAIQKALQVPRPINMNLVNAQQARRVLDRLVGYKLSPVLSKKVKSGLSAGRVQSVTLKLVIDREREIQNFKPDEYWDFFSHLSKNKISFKAKLLQKEPPKSEAEVIGIVKKLDGAVYRASNVTKSITKRHAYAPFTTSSMQQSAGTFLQLSLKRITMAAQNLYQGVNLGEQGATALVTYIRTDSVRISPEAAASAKEFIVKKFGSQYYPETPNIFKSKKTAQDAHEAIRPTHIEITPDEVDRYLIPQKRLDEAKLYRLIYNRFLSSQMADATFNTTKVDIDANDVKFRVNGRTPIFDGWLVLNAKSKHKEEDKTDDDENTVAELPEINVGDVLDFIKLEYAQKFTSPPARYTEPSLVKAMEENGIGRPATYNPTIQLLFNRLYIQHDEDNKRAVKPTELGFTVVDWLSKYFVKVMDIGFTADMEDKLDDIAANGIDWTKVVDDFYKPFSETIQFAKEHGEESRVAPELTDILCEKCGKPMAVRVGRFGKFLGCSGYPECKNLKPFGPPAFNCPKCGAGVFKRNGKKSVFYGCSNYPKCDFMCWKSDLEKYLPKEQK
ncbi:MAG: type I DNA topoisomerase [Christensenellaceae bacterium]|jgi:DNA topoisomerase-1|nr:type I DNA topoisomerase [Christensenellaceae bacterium]